MRRSQIVALVALLLITCATLAAIPFLQLRADRADRARGAAAGIALVHRFDCTYGRSLAELLSSGAYSTSLQSAVSYQQAEHQHGPERKATLKLAKAQQLRAADLLRQYGQIQPLTPAADRIPCPPR